LFSGAGGLSLGFEMAGFKIALAIESQKNYMDTYKLNNPKCICLNADITELKPNEIERKYLNNGKIKGIIGGPPCKGFSTVGNRKLTDPRNMLIYYFIQWVDYFKPNFYVMENVPGILSMDKGGVVKKVKNIYDDIGYSCNMHVLLATEFGVPQVRKRVFLIGNSSSLRDIKIKKTNQQDAKQKALFEESNLPPFLTVKEAFSDIIDVPPIVGKISDDVAIEYPNSTKTKYQKYLRANSETLYDHYAPNHSALVKKRISLIKPGKNHSSLPKEYQLKGGYSNIYGRLELNKPADTITANCGCVSAPGRFIHPVQDRAISVREAARLQSFPDSYRFTGNLSEKYKQVGNAVPPLMAFAIAKSIKRDRVKKLTN